MSAIRKEKQRDYKSEVGDRLAYAIKASRISRAALARKSGVRVDAIGRLERGLRLPGVPDLKKLAGVLHIPGAWLVLGEGPLPEIPLAAPDDRDRRRRDDGDGDIGSDPEPT